MIQLFLVCQQASALYYVHNENIHQIRCCRPRQLTRFTVQTVLLRHVTLLGEYKTIKTRLGSSRTLEYFSILTTIATVMFVIKTNHAL